MLRLCNSFYGHVNQSKTERDSARHKSESVAKKTSDEKAFLVSRAELDDSRKHKKTEPTSKQEVNGPSLSRTGTVTCFKAPASHSQGSARVSESERQCREWYETYEKYSTTATNQPLTPPRRPWTWTRNNVNFLVWKCVLCCRCALVEGTWFFFLRCFFLSPRRTMGENREAKNI